MGVLTAAALFGFVLGGDAVADNSALLHLLLVVPAEGPIIVTGASIGSLLGQVIPVSPSERKILLAVVDERIKHVPVVDDDGRLVGICTRTDLLKVRRRHADLERRQTGVTRRRLRLPKRASPTSPAREDSGP